MQTATRTIHLGDTTITVEMCDDHVQWTVFGVEEDDVVAGCTRDESSAWEAALFVWSPLGQESELAKSEARAYERRYYASA